MSFNSISETAFAAISPRSLVLYAKSLGWEFFEDFGSAAHVYVHKTHGEILLPRSQELGDYHRAVYDAVKRFTRITKGTEKSVFEAITGSEFDVIRFAVESADDGSIYFDDALKLHNQAKEALLAAACATKTRQAVYRAGANKEAVRYLERVKLAQSERGSYVVRLHSPVPPQLQSDLFENEPFEEQPFERQVTTTFMNALEKSKYLLESAVAGGGDNLDEFVQYGVSANLCESLGKMLENKANLKISTTWSKGRPKEQRIKTVSFNESSSDYFKEVARILRIKEPRRDISILASIHKLARRDASEVGKIYFNALVDEERLTVSAELNEASYSMATNAHKAREMVEITGDLERVGSRWQMARAKILNVTETKIEEE